MEIKVAVQFNNARVFDISRIDVLKGQSFSLYLGADDPSVLKDLSWFSDNDPVLDMAVSLDSSMSASTAVNEGVCTILIMGKSRNIIKEITVRVVDTLLPPADNLNAQAGEALPK